MIAQHFFFISWEAINAYLAKRNTCGPKNMWRHLLVFIEWYKSQCMPFRICEHLTKTEQRYRFHVKLCALWLGGGITFAHNWLVSCDRNKVHEYYTLHHLGLTNVTSITIITKCICFIFLQLLRTGRVFVVLALKMKILIKWINLTSIS